MAVQVSSDYRPNLEEVILRYQNYVIRPWKPEDREEVAVIVQTCLTEFGMFIEIDDVEFRDYVEVEGHFWKNKMGELWVYQELETGKIIGSGGYREIEKGSKIVEIKRLYLSRHARGKGLGRKMLRH